MRQSLVTITAGCLLVATAGIAGSARADDQAGSVERTFDLQFESAVLARKGESVLTHAEVDAYMSQIPEQHRAGVLFDRERISRLMENLMLKRQVVSEAVAAGFHARPDTQAKLYHALVEALTSIYLDHYVDTNDAESYEARARELYLLDPKRFAGPDRLDFAHILIVDEPGRELAAMRRIIEIYEQVSEQPAAFSELAVEHSGDPSVEDNAGVYSDVAVNELDERFADHLLDVEPGQITEPFLTRFGWHVARLDAIKESVPESFEAVRDRAIETVREEHRAELRDEYLKRLNQSGSWEFVEGGLDALLARYGVAPGADGALQSAVPLEETGP
ncbi:MAG: hypothetical protein HND55_03030 [Pseudomonadota bacterium]|nr:MAG: hypothetical protein HND55_03030 [Pseudomonadota bacterium]